MDPVTPQESRLRQSRKRAQNERVTKMPRLDTTIIRSQIDSLLQANPELLEDEVLRADMLEGSTNFQDFLQQLERTRQETNGLITGIEAVMKDLGSRKGRFERREESIRELIFNLLQWGMLRKVELPEATLSIRAGVPKVIVTDESKIPKAFQRVKTEPDKIKIKAALEEGKDIPGVELSNAQETLTIRIK